MSDKYVYDRNQKGMLEKAKEASSFMFWCIMVGGGLGATYGNIYYGGIYNSLLGFAAGMAIYAFFGVVAKFFEIS
jgi:hypothetical protein